MDDRLLREPEVMELTGLGRTTIWRYERDGVFPRRRKIGGHVVAWLESEVSAWIDGLPTVKGGNDEA